jgi:hypothetical protein
MSVRYRVDIRKFPPQDPASDRSPDETRREQLMDLPPTDYIADKLIWTRYTLGQLSDRPGNLTRERLESDLAILEPQLALCLERDQLAANRPDGCWCLGLGGRTQRWVPVQDDDGERAYLRTFRDYCDCPDGQEAKAVAERLGMPA